MDCSEHHHTPGAARETRGPGGDDNASTGFLPISLALALFLSGLFVLGVVPSSCDTKVSTTPTAGAAANPSP